MCSPSCAAWAVTAQHLRAPHEGRALHHPDAGLLAKVVDMLDHVPMEDRDTKGDLYEYMLGKIAAPARTASSARRATSSADGGADRAHAQGRDLRPGQRHLRLSGGRRRVPAREAPGNSRRRAREHFHHGMFHGYDFDNTMLRIGSMNMALHGVDNPDIRYKDSLAQDHAGDEEKYSPHPGQPAVCRQLDYENTAKDLLAIVKTKKTELLFLALFLRLLKPGGRAAVIVPDGVLFGSSKAHKELRRMIVEEQKLDAVMSLPSGVFKPYAGVSTAILLFTKTNSGGTDHVWFYDMQADGWSLDDKRQPLLAEDKLGVTCLPARLERSRTRQEQPAGCAGALAATRRPPSGSARAPTRASACPRPTSRRTATTCPSTATRKWCMRRWSICRRRDSGEAGGAGGGDSGGDERA
jgi:type I restriction enzyme M protein